MFKCVVCVTEIEDVCAFHLPQKQGKNNGLRVCVGELLVICVRKQESLDVFLRMCMSDAASLRESSTSSRINRQKGARNAASSLGFLGTIGDQLVNSANN